MQLTSGQLVTDSVTTFEFNYYYLTNPYEGDILVEVNQTNTVGDVDVYIQIGTLPTRSSYFQRDISTDQGVRFTLASAAAGTWYFGVYGFLSASYSIRVTLMGTPIDQLISDSYTGSCPNACSGNGDCLGGSCQCYSGYVGDDCSIAARGISVGSPLTGTVATGSWDYYYYNFVNDATHNSFVITMTEVLQLST